jgi:hypothetical protein
LEDLTSGKSVPSRFFAVMESVMEIANSSNRCTTGGKYISPIHAIAIILAHGVVRLHQRQKELDNRTEQSVHDCVLATKGETQ